MDIQKFNLIVGQASRPNVSWEVYHKNLRSDIGKPGRDFLKARGFDSSTVKHFRIGYTENREISIPVFKNGDLVDYKFRNVDEKKFRRHQGGETWVVNEEAFKWAKEDGYIVCVEGEFDAMALYQLGIRSVVSTTGGAQGATPWLNDIPDDTKIFICYDNDEPGQEAATKIADRIGIERCLNMMFEVKDANDFLLNGGTKEQFEEMMESAKKFQVEGILRLDTVIDSLEKNKVQRIPTFLTRLTSHLGGGVPKAGIITLSGKPKSGKSSLLMNMVVNHAREGTPTLLVSLENDLYFTVQRLFEIIMNKRYKDFTEEDILELKEKITDMPLYLDVSLGNWNIGRIEKVVSQMKRLYGVEIFGFDHLSYLSGEEVKDIDGVMRRLKMMSRNLNIVSYIVSHVTKMESENTWPTPNDLRGSASIAQESNAVLFMQHNKTGSILEIALSRMSQDKLWLPIEFDGTTGVISDDFSKPVKRYGEIIPDEDIEPVNLNLNKPIDL